MSIGELQSVYGDRLVVLTHDDEVTGSPIVDITHYVQDDDIAIWIDFNDDGTVTAWL